MASIGDKDSCMSAALAIEGTSLISTAEVDARGFPKGCYKYVTSGVQLNLFGEYPGPRNAEVSPICKSFG